MRGASPVVTPPLVMTGTGSVGIVTVMSWVLEPLAAGLLTVYVARYTVLLVAV